MKRILPLLLCLLLLAFYISAFFVYIDFLAYGTGAFADSFAF